MTACRAARCFAFGNSSLRVPRNRGSLLVAPKSSADENVDSEGSRHLCRASMPTETRGLSTRSDVDSTDGLTLPRLTRICCRLRTEFRVPPYVSAQRWRTTD
jgi:hypothetical protein